MGTWKREDKDFTMREHNGMYTVTRFHDKNNPLHIYHTNLELLRYFCFESYDIQIPDTAV